MTARSQTDVMLAQRDPIRGARLLRAGCLVLGVTAKRLTQHPEAVLADIRALAALAASR